MTTVTGADRICKPRVSDHIVYLHRDPRTGSVFYVGEGRAGRAWEASARSPDHVKSLESLFSAGFTMAHVVEIYKSRLTKDQAKEVEAELIELFDLRTLENRANGKPKKKSVKKKEQAKLTKSFFASLKPVERATYFFGTNLNIVQYRTGRISIWATGTGPKGRKKLHVFQIVPNEALTTKMLEKIKKLHKSAVADIKGGRHE